MRRVARCQGCHERGRQLRRPYIFSEIQVLLPSKGKGHDWTKDDGIGKALFGGPSCSATNNSAAIAACHSSESCSAFGSLVMYCAASRSVTNGFSARQDDLIEKPLIP